MTRRRQRGELPSEYAKLKSGSKTWWQKPTRDHTPVHEKVFSVCESLAKDHQIRRDAYLTYARQYSSHPLTGLTPHTYAYRTKEYKRLRYNLIRAMIDTLVSLVASDRPVPTIMTDNTSAMMLKHAEKLNKLVLGIFEQNCVYEAGPLVARDMFLIGPGAFQVGVDHDNNIKIERTWFAEYLYDYADAYYGKPRSLHRVRNVHREVALATWPDKANILRLTPTYEENNVRKSDQVTDFIQVIESWHLRSNEKAKDGVHTITVENGDILYEEWPLDRFPVVWQNFGDVIFGVESEGAAAQIAGHHISLNQHLTTMEESLHRLAVPRVWVDSNSNVVLDWIDNRIGAIMTYDGAGGNPPIVDNPRVLEPGWVEHTRWIIESAMDILGLNQLATSGSVPRGLESGKAIQEAGDAVGQRFRWIQRKYEQLFLDLAKTVIDFAYWKWKDEGKTVRVKGRRFVETIDFKRIDLKPNEFEVTVWPTSMLPKSPAGKFDALMKFIEAGWLSKEEAMELYNIPDIERAASIASAALEDLDLTIDAMLFDKVQPGDLPTEQMSKYNQASDEAEKELILSDFMYDPPEPAQNLALGIRRMSAAYLKYRHTDVPQSRLDLLLRWVSDAKKLMQPPQQAQQPGPAGQLPMAQTVAEPAGQGMGMAPDGMLPPPPMMPGV